MSKPTEKKYKLKLMVDMFDIPEERFDDFLVDLKKWHKVGKAFNSLAQTISKAVNEKLPDDYITMRWIDDGKHDGAVRINVVQPHNKEKGGE